MSVDKEELTRQCEEKVESRVIHSCQADRDVHCTHCHASYHSPAKWAVLVSEFTDGTFKAQRGLVA